MKEVLKIYVKGHPEPQPRPRAVRRGRFIRVFSPVTPWRKLVQSKLESAWRVFSPDPRSGHRGVGSERESLTGAVRVTLTFYFERTQEQLAHPFKYGREAFPMATEGKGDVDNLAKAVLDAMQDAGVLKNDAQAYHVDASKWRSGIGGAPGVAILVELWGEEDGLLFEAAVEEMARNSQ